ncbi:hypothetical protein [Haloarcula amylovorans]|uniref:hypothetical protein n=1 Tax=Haloarcula amylovorans TaxID=2562280 RepID=UPI0010762701|nr:hypothetical protein [Halomicroarcula amylolytica]
MVEDARLQIYTDEALNTKLDKRADSAGLSKSKYCELILKNHHGMDLDGRLSRYSANDDVVSTIDRTSTEIIAAIEELKQETTSDVEHLQSLRTMYVLSLWELLKEEYSPEKREAAIKRAALQMADSPVTQTSDGRESDREGSSPLDSLLAVDR